MTTRLNQIKRSTVCLKVAKISALSSKNLLDKYEHLAGEDLGYKPNGFEKAKFEYSPLSMLPNKAFKKDDVKSIAKSKSDFSYDSNHTFFGFTKGLMNLKTCH